MKHLITLFILVCLCSDETALGKEFSLEECIDRALANNSALQSSSFRHRATTEHIYVAKTSFLPSVSFSAQYRYQDKPDRLTVPANALANGIPESASEFPLSDRDYYGGEISFYQPVYTGGLLTSRLSRAIAVSEESRFSRDRHRDSVIRDVKSAYYEANIARLAFEADDSIVAAKVERLRVLTERNKEGYVPKEEVLLQEADLALAELQMQRNQDRFHNSLARLGSLMDFPKNEPLNLASSGVVKLLNVPLDTLIDEALHNRKDLAAIRKRSEINRNDKDIAMAGYFPQISFGGSYRVQKQSEMLRPNQWMLIAKLDWPIFEWGKTTADVRRLNSLISSSSYEEREAEKEIALSVQISFRSVKDKERLVSAREKQLKAYKAILDATAERYSQGYKKFSELLQAEADFMVVTSDYFIALNDLCTELSQLEYLVSVPLAKWTTTIDPFQMETGPYQYKKKISFGCQEGNVSCVDEMPNNHKSIALDKK